MSQRCQASSECVQLHLSVQIQYDGDGICTPVTAFGLLRAIPTLFAIRAFFRNQEQLARHFLAGGIDEIESKYDPISGDTDIDTAFRKLVECDYFTIESNYFRTIFAASFAKLDFKNSFPEADYSSLVAALPAMRHMAPARTLREMAARGDRDLSPLLPTFRHHCRWGLDIREARWDEDRDFVEELLMNFPTSAVGSPRPAYERRGQKRCRGYQHKTQKFQSEAGSPAKFCLAPRGDA